jgi:hypothetical protein
MSGLGKAAAGAALTMAVVLGTTPIAAQQPTGDEPQITIDLNVEGVGQVGEAILTPAGEQTRVAIEVAGAPADAALQGFLLEGACAESGEVIAELGALQAGADGSGALSSEVPIDIETITSASLSVEVRQADARVACGQYMAMGEVEAAPPAREPIPDPLSVPDQQDDVPPQDTPPLPDPQQ